MSDQAAGPTSLQRYVRGTLVAGYIALIALGWITDAQPRIFWTILLPLLPVSIVLMGFANWRRVCPLAWFGEVGRQLNRGAQRRVPRWLDRWFLVVMFSVLLAMLVLRLVAINGDGRWLAGSLAGLALAAIVVNRVFTGKTWCNFFCPVGLIERVYTEPRSLPTTPNSECVRCTACKSSCPDIDQENAYWHDLTTNGRRLATYAFPGLVLAFYTYYWLRHGDWEAYFDGRWTLMPVSSALVLGPGLFFAPELPALAAAILTLAGFSAASYLLFVLIESLTAGFVPDGERRRHMVLALSAFTAFSIFYFFAGAPALRSLPGGVRFVAFTAPLVATLFLAKRWGRTRESFIRERGAAHLLRNWPFDEPPPSDPGEVYAWIKASEHTREQNVVAYANTVREMIADGLVRKGELRLLVEVRKQLGISEREHEKLLERLSEEERDLLERDRTGGVEERTQLEGYQTVLAEALVRHAPEQEITKLRLAFGVDREAHERLLQRMRGESGVILQAARDQLERVRKVRRDLEMLASPEPSDAEAFLGHLLLREQNDGINRLLDQLEVLGPAERIQSLRPGLCGGDEATRRAAARQLAEACPQAEDLTRELEPWVVERMPAGSGRDTGGRAGMLERRARSSDIFVRAAVAWVAAGSADPAARDITDGAGRDPAALVREAAGLAGRRAPARPGSGTRFEELATIEKMQFLRTVPLFAELDPVDLHDLALFVKEESLAPAGTLCEEGAVDAGDLFILLSGRASVTIRAGDESGKTGGEREVAVLEAGEIIGEMSILDCSPRSATVRPKDGPIRVLRISGQRFRSRLLPRARVARPLLATLAQRIRDMSRRVVGGS